METTRSLYVLAGITLLHVGWSIAGATFGADILVAGPFAVGVYALTGAIGVVLAPVFFAALYVDASAVRAGTSAWKPDRRLWVGGGAIAVLVTYVAIHRLPVAVVGLAYLLRRARSATRREASTVARKTQTVAADDTEAERTAAGVAVHVLALPTAGLGAAVVYLASANSFTRANARHALNWYLSILAFTAVAHVTLAVSADEGHLLGYAISGPLLPQPLATVVGLLGLVLVALSVVGWGLTVVFAAVAAGHAALGKRWSYPFAGRFVERLA